MASGSKSSGREYSRNGPQKPELWLFFCLKLITLQVEEFHVFHETAEKKNYTPGPLSAIFFFPAKAEREIEFEFPSFSHVFKTFSCFFVCKIVK